MTRTDNVKKNLFFNIVKFATQLVLQFILRTILIRIMGVEYLGLNGLFSNIFSFLNLAELGIGTAIAFSMYKPVADNDIEKVKALQALYKKFYLIITFIVAGIGLIVLPFLDFLVSGEEAVNINIYLLYIMYLVNTLVGYFSAHKRAILFAYQRADVENKVKTVCLILMTGVQIAVLLIFKNYYLYFAINIISSLIESILIEIIAKKMFPQLIGKSNKLDSKTKKEIYKNVTALGIHKVCGTFINSTDNIIISAILGIATLGVYSNYYLVISSIISVYTLFANAIASSVGNMIASESKEYVYSKFKMINFLFSIFSAFCTVCMLVLFQPFMKVWTGGGIYLFDFSTVILLCISFYIVRMRQAVIIFKDSAGLYWHNKVSPIIEALVNVVLSIILGLFMGVNGVILGTIISAIVAPMILEPNVLFKHYFNKSVWIYLKQFLIDAVITILVGCACYFICSFIPDGGIWQLLVKFAVCIVSCAGLLIVIYSPTKEFKNVIVWLKQLLNKKQKDLNN